MVTDPRQTPLWERVARALGFNPVRLRWRWERFKIGQERKQRAADNQARALRYRHKQCPQCTLTVDAKERHCPRCGRRLLGPMLSRLQRQLRAIFPVDALSYTTTFVTFNVALYLAMVMRSGGLAALFRSLQPSTVVRFGGWFIPLMLVHGQWWRLVTAGFLHFSPLHIIFNSLWLLQLGPQIEEVLGRKRYLLLYVASGVGGFALSIGYRLLRGGTHLMGVGAGASGIVFGLIAAGLTLAYIRRAPGSDVFRQGLAKWGIYAVVFSLLPGIDLAAHLGGAVAGGLAALGLATHDQARRLPEPLWTVIELLVLLVLIGSFALAVSSPLR